MAQQEEMNFLDEVKEDADKAIPNDDKLRKLSDLCADQINTEDEILSLENKLAAAKERLKSYSEFYIPELMSEVGIREFKLSNGLKVSVKPYFAGKITDENAEEAYQWLESHGYADIIKGELIVQFRRSENVDEIEELAHQLGFETKDKLGVHHQTLSAFIKEQVTEGHEIPRDLLGVHTGFKTKIGR